MVKKGKKMIKRTKENFTTNEILKTRKGGPMKDKRKDSRKKVKENLKKDW